MARSAPSPPAPLDPPEPYIHPSLSIQPHPTSSEKGYSVIATNPIPAGTLLIRERPLILLEGGDVTVTALRKAWNALTDAEKATFWNLASAHGLDLEPSQTTETNGDEKLSEKERYLRDLTRHATDHHVEFAPPPPNDPMPLVPRLATTHHAPQGLWDRHVAHARAAPYRTVLSTFATNAVAIPAWDAVDADDDAAWGTGGAAVFPAAARLNHSCVPAAAFTWRALDSPAPAGASAALDDHAPPARGVQDVLAARTLRPGDECTIAYVDAWRPPAVRAALLRPYGFRCDCPACDPGNGSRGAGFYEASRARRYAWAAIEEGTPADGRFWPAERGEQGERLRGAVEAAGLLRAEGAWSSRLGRIYHDIALLAWDAGDAALAETAGREAIWVYAMCCGPDHRSTLLQRARFREMMATIRAEVGKADGRDSDEAAEGSVVEEKLAELGM